MITSLVCFELVIYQSQSEPMGFIWIKPCVPPSILHRNIQSIRNVQSIILISFTPTDWWPPTTATCPQRDSYGWNMWRDSGNALTPWGRVAHCICVSKVTIIGSGNGLAPGRRQAIIWISAVVFLIGTKFSEIWIKIHIFSFENVVCEIAVLLSRPQCVNGSPCFMHARTTPHTITNNLLHQETIDVRWWTGPTGTSHHYKQ